MPQVTRSCARAECTEVFTVGRQSDSKRYCSRSCAQSVNNRGRSRNPRGFNQHLPRPPKICGREGCGLRITGGSNQAFCSRKCREHGSTTQGSQVGPTPNNTKATGAVSEAIALARYVELGFNVSQPFGDNARYDLIVDKDGELIRVQVKTGRSDGTCITFPCRSSSAHGGGPRRHYRGQADVFAVYCPETGQVYEVDVEQCGLTAQSLRLGEKEGRSNTKWAVDHVL